MSTSKPQMHDMLSKAFESTAILNEALATDSPMDRSTKLRLRKTVNGLKDMMDSVLKFEKDVTKDVVEGMEEVIRNTEAKLDGKSVSFKADAEFNTAETNLSQAA